MYFEKEARWDNEMKYNLLVGEGAEEAHFMNRMA